MIEYDPTTLEPYHPLVLAVQANDREAETNGLEATIKDIGLELPELLHMAEQRALRAVLVHSGRFNELGGTERREVALNAAERLLYALLCSVYLDGITLGWRAANIASLR